MLLENQQKLDFFIKNFALSEGCCKAKSIHLKSLPPHKENLRKNIRENNIQKLVYKKNFNLVIVDVDFPCFEKINRFIFFSIAMLNISLIFDSSKNTTIKIL